MVGQPVDQGDGARGVGKDGVPVLEGQVGGDQQGAVFVAAADELEDQVRGTGVVGEVAQFVDSTIAWGACSGAGGVRVRGRSPVR